MLVKAQFLSRGGKYTRVFNTNRVIYFDASGVLFDHNDHAPFAAGEYDRIMDLLRHVDPDRIMV